MTEQEEIREGIKQSIHPECFFTNTKCSPQKDSVDLATEERRQGCIRCRIHLDGLLQFLHSQGVVIRGQSLGASHPHLVNYYTVEPLIKEILR